MKYILIILSFIIGIPIHMSAKENTDTIRRPIIENQLDDIVVFMNDRESICLEQITITHSQLDSVLIKITKGLNSESDLCFYITFMKYDDKIYIEIFEDYPNDYLFEIKNKKSSLYQKLNREIYGYVEYSGIDIYLLIFPNPHQPSKNDLFNLVSKTENRVTVQHKPKKYSFVQENPMWLYEYFDGDINLIKSVNDKVFLLIHK